MQARTLLEGARRAERQLRAAVEKQRTCDALARAVGPGEKLSALRSDLARRAEAWAGEQLRAAAAIDRIEDPVGREVLRYRYLDGLDWREIAARMRFSREWLWRVHRRALEALESMEA